MKRILFFILGIMLLSSPVFAGDTTSNGYFYLPSYGATGASERTSWYNSLVATDAIIKQLVDYKNTGNAATATALAANGSNCPAGYYPLGVDASGNVETCTSATTGTVIQVTAASPLVSSGGATPVISISLTNDQQGLLYNNLGDITSSPRLKWDSDSNTLNVTGIIAATTLNATNINVTTFSAGTVEATGTGTSSFVQGLVVNDGGTASNADDAFRVEGDGEDKLILTIPQSNLVRFGDGDTNYIQINQTGQMTAVGSASIPAGAVTNGTSVTADSAGDIVIDTTDDQFRYFGASSQRVLSYKKDKGIYLESPTTSDTAITVQIALDAITLSSVNCIADPVDNNPKTVVMQLKECNSTGDSCVATQSRPMQCDNDGDSLTTFDNAGIDANDWLQLNVSAVTGTVTGVTFQWGYSIDAK